MKTVDARVKREIHSGNTNGGKMKKMQILFLSGVFIFHCVAVMAADNADLGGIFYDKAVSEYLGGSRDEAIISMEKSLKYSPDNDNARKILARLLVQRASDYFYTNEIEKSYIDIKEAKKILPKDSQVDRLYEFVKASFDERYKPAQGAPGAQEQKELVKFMTGAYLENRLPIAVSADSQIGFTRGEITAMLAVFGVGILILFLSVLNGFDKLAESRKHEAYSQRIELERVKWAVSGGKGRVIQPPSDPASAASMVSSGLSKAPSEMERLLKNPYAAVRAKGLIILEAEMLINDGKLRTAAKLLEPLFNDQDPLIAANAARAACGYDFNRGMSALEKIAAGDRQQRTAAMHVLGWVPSARSIKTLSRAVSDTDGKIVIAAVNSLKLIKDSGYTGVPKKAVDEVERLLAVIMIKK